MTLHPRGNLEADRALHIVVGEERPTPIELRVLRLKPTAETQRARRSAERLSNLRMPNPRVFFRR